MKTYVLENEYLNEVFKITDNKRAEILLRCNGVPKLGTKEFISIFIWSELKRGISFLNRMSGDRDFLPRYANFIIRDMMEQVIEYKYLMKHEELIESYLGASEKEVPEQTDIVKKFKIFGSRRFPGKGRKSVHDMAAEVGEERKKNESEELTLYGIYSILSELCHNSFYESLVRKTEEIDTKEECLAMEEFHVIFVEFIISSFLETYKEI
ncbi:MAG: hypothetical protein E7247_09510 [Paenibacillaceae bacterium]|nr:hypothetical protein [Paenibacillaceae bacterium]